MSAIIRICCLLPFMCCFPTTIQTNDIVYGLIETYLNEYLIEITGYSFHKWTSRINKYKCKNFKQILHRVLRNAFIKHKFSLFGKNGHWDIYMEKQLSYAIFQKVIHYYDNTEVEILLLDIPTNSLSVIKIKEQTHDFTDKINSFMKNFACNKEGDEIDMNTTDPAITNALYHKFMIILENVVGDVDFMDNMVDRINRSYENIEKAYITQEQAAMDLIVP